nr:hypothetical protein [uncultured Draconibacterium sp.]
MMRGIFLISFFVLSLVFKSNANEHRGVFFKSKEVSLENRTGIDLTEDGTITYQNSFSIEFDILFRDLDERYGYVLQLKETNDGHQFDLIYNIDGRFPDLFVVLDKKETNLQMALSREQIELVNRWHKFRLTVDAVSGDVAMTFGGKTVTDKIELPASSELEWTFGIVDRYGFEIDEVPPMSVRNIRFSEQNNLKYFWPLDYTTGNTVKDSVDGKEAEIINPAWVVEQHQTWKQVRSFEFSEMPQIAFNKNTEAFYFVERKQGITKFSLNERKVSTIKYRSGNPFYEDAQQVFFDKNDRLRTYSKYKNLAPAFNEASRTWDNRYDTLAYLPKYWHHNSFLHPVDGAFMAIGGYGFFTYFNTIRKLDERTKTWKELKLKGELFEPRYLASLGQSKNDSVYYLFGGLGNETGKQILGKEFYYDLYKIDFGADTISKVWEVEEIDDESYTPVNSMIINEQENCFYTLCFSHGNNETALQLIKADLNNPEYKFIGSKIPYTFYDITSFADLYNWETHNKILALTMHEAADGKFKVNIYSLNYPPSEGELAPTGEKKTGKFHVAYFIFGALALLLIGGVTIILGKAKKSKTESRKTTLNLLPDEPNNSDEPLQGRILTFGGFQVFDRNGKDITYRFSPTVKELFLLIFLNTVDGNTGISSKKIQEFLWPDKSEHNAKNNRGVNIKKLRSILEDVGDITITFDGNYWRMSHCEDVFCDFEYIKEYNKIGFDISRIKEFNTVMSILSRGNFLLNTETEWLDRWKDNISGRIVNRLEEVCELLDIRKNEKELLEITDVLFTFDQMNETALELKCNILYHQGKHSLAKEIYNHYIKLYQKLYNEDFKRSFKELVS